LTQILLYMVWRSLSTLQVERDSITAEQAQVCSGRPRYYMYPSPSPGLSWCMIHAQHQFGWKGVLYDDQRWRVSKGNPDEPMICDLHTYFTCLVTTPFNKRPVAEHFSCLSMTSSLKHITQSWACYNGGRPWTPRWPGGSSRLHMCTWAGRPSAPIYGRCPFPFFWDAPFGELADHALQILTVIQLFSPTFTSLFF
jgi:hypothetical protein